MGNDSNGGASYLFQMPLVGDGKGLRIFQAMTGVGWYLLRSFVCTA